MMKFGFEREFFVVKTGKKKAEKGQADEYVLCPLGVPRDDCGFLAESRSEPHNDPLKAAYLLLAEEDRMRHSLPKGIRLKLIDTVELPAELLHAAIRANGKNAFPSERGSLYGLDYPIDDKLNRAGMHIHFSNLRSIETKTDGTVNVSQMMDMPAIIQKLDRAFEAEIKAANRLAGLYEMKTHGFEYRSLPASIDVRKVAAVLK